VQNYRDFTAEVLGPITQLAVLEVPLTSALGCCAAVEVTAGFPVPGFRQASLNGVALACADALEASRTTPVILPIGARVAAGSVAEPLAAGHCARVAAGAPVPAGADAVVPIGECRVEDDKVILVAPPRPGQGFRGIGSQFDAGDVVVSEGTYLGHVGIAELALAGVPRVTVYPRPRVVVVTIGSELVRVSDPVGDSSVHDAAGVLLTTTAQRLGADCYRVGPVPDDARAVRDAIEDQLVRADIVVTVGGIDDPDDVLRAELGATGQARFDGPPLVPCGAYGLGRVGPDGTPIVMLPSDPATALLAFHALARPIIADMLGRDPYARQAAIAAPGATAEGSILVPGRFEQDRFVPVHGEVTSLRALNTVTAIAICHAESTSAEVVEWPH
jgi:molybdopterin molybdotransferase